MFDYSFPKEIPQYTEQIPLYRATMYETFSRRNEDVKAGLEKRIKRYMKVFKTNATAEDYGTRVILKDGLKVLEIYVPSDSFWWTDLEVAYREKNVSEGKLPNDKEAKKMATDYINDLCPWRENAKFVSVGKSSSAISKREDRTQEVIDTELHVTFAFSVDNVQVMGPGAKMKVSLIEGGRLSGFLCFWRELVKEKSVKAIHPLVALDRLIHGARFEHFTSKDHLSLETMTFGQYAFPPFEFQKYLFPVYEVRGTLQTELLGKYPLTLYLPAVESDPEVLKTLGIFNQANITRMIASTK